MKIVTSKRFLDVCEAGKSGVISVTLSTYWSNRVDCRGFVWLYRYTQWWFMAFGGLVEQSRANRRKGRAIEDWSEWGVGAGLLLQSGC